MVQELQHILYVVCPEITGQSNIIINKIVTFNIWLQIFFSHWSLELIDITRRWVSYPQIKAESLHLKHIFIVSFQVHCGGLQSQNDENCVKVQLFMDLTVNSNVNALFKIYEYNNNLRTIYLYFIGVHFYFISEVFIFLTLYSKCSFSQSWFIFYNDIFLIDTFIT